MFIRTFENRHYFFILALALTSCTDDGSGMEAAGTETGTGSETDSETGGAMMLAIIGTYTDDFGDSYTITETEWASMFLGSVAIAEYNNDEMWLVGQNADTNMYNPSLWSRFDWTWDTDNNLYYCQSVYDGPTIDDAKAGSANPDDLMMGCGGMFPWTKLIP